MKEADELREWIENLERLRAADEQQGYRLLDALCAAYEARLDAMRADIRRVVEALDGLSSETGITAAPGISQLRDALGAHGLNDQELPRAIEAVRKHLPPVKP